MTAEVTAAISDPFSGRLSEWNMLERDIGRCKERLARLELSEERKRIAKKHPLLCGRIYFPQWFKGNETPEFHFEIVNGYLEFERFAVAAPVGSAKTTVLTKCCSLYSILFEKDVNDVLLVSSAQGIAGMFLDDMGARCKASEELAEDFGDEKGCFWGSHWGSDCLEFVLSDGNGGRRRKVIRTVGRGGALRGRRPDRIIVDDPEDEESVKSEKQRGDFSTWFWGALVNRLTKGKKLTYIGTCMTPETFLVGMLNSPPAGWQVRSYAMLNEEKGESLWEEMWPVKTLRARREEVGEAAFAAEFQNQPVNNWHQLLFDTTKVKIGMHQPDESDWVSVTIDPSFRVGGDAWGLTMVAVDRKGQWNWIVAKKEQTGTEGWLAALKEVRDKYPRIHVLGVEAGGGQVATEYVLNDWMRQNGVGFPAVHYLTHSRGTASKTARIGNLTSIVNSGRLTMMPGMTMAMNDLKSYRAGLEHQDDHLLDALSMHLEVQHARTPSEIPARTPEEIRHERFRSLKKMIERGKVAAFPLRSRYL